MEGFDVDVALDADLGALTAVWLGRMRLADAIAAGAVRIDGEDEARRGFPKWFGLSPFANGGAERVLSRVGPALRETR